MRTKPPRGSHRTADELLDALCEAERELHTFGGIDRIRRRQEALAVALHAGCSPDRIARALGVTPRDVVAWRP